MKYSPVSSILRKYQCSYADSFRVHIYRLLPTSPRIAHLNFNFNNNSNTVFTSTKYSVLV